MAFSEIDNTCLKSGLKLETNLSQIKGDVVNVLIESLKYCSMEIPNMPIIERIMYKHHIAFKTQVAIKEIMSKGDPVISAFTTMGNYDRNCNIKWLIKILNDLHELRPLQKIVDTGPPIINLKSPMKIKSGESITFEISTISEAKIQWWKQSNGLTEIVSDHHVKKFAIAQNVSYKTKKTDNGYFHIEATCRGGFRKLSSSICVGDCESIGCNSSNTIPENGLVEIIPSQESDGMKRIALLVGIMNYENDNQKLKAPETDILYLERVLLRLGFTVYCFGDLCKRQMISVLEQFSKLCEADNTIIFFYFAGHGFREKMGDNLELIDGRMPIKEVLNILVKKKPKLAVSLFDMCRDNSCESETKAQDVVEAIAPFSENLIVVMSTLPTRKAYEKPNGCENTSLIMKPLCDSLSQYGSKHPINFVLARFITSCENIDQKPTLLAVPINEKLGINILNSRISLRLEWVRIPEDQEIMKSITIDSKIFHNFINIYINKNDMDNIFKPRICISSRSKHEASHDGIIKINLFNYKEILKTDKYLEINYQLFQKSNIMSNYPIKVFIPEEIILFL